MGERFLFELLERSGDAAIVIAPDGRIRFWNVAAEALFGYSAAQALDQNCDQLLRGRNAVGAQVCRHDCQIRDCGARGETVPSFDLEVRLPDGERRWVSLSNIFYRDRRTGETWMVHLARDISGGKNREQMVENLLSLMHQLEVQPPAATPAAMEAAAPLSVRQRQILRCLAQGKDAAAVASELGITPQSLRNHLHHINRKLNTHDRLGAVTQAQRRHLI